MASDFTASDVAAPAPRSTRPVTLDSVDRQILELLQTDGRMANAEIARRLGMAPSAIFDRIRKLEERRVITGYEARVDPRMLGLGLTAFIFVRADEITANARTADELGRMGEVLEVHHIAGEDCFLVKVRVADTEALGVLLRERISAIKSVRSTRTTIALGTSKETGHLPTGPSANGDAGR
jgi:Lrp/AsnC family transcriptional regulator, leucine-responsive regulatory protein